MKTFLQWIWKACLGIGAQALRSGVSSPGALATTPVAGEHFTLPEGGAGLRLHRQRAEPTQRRLTLTCSRAI
jgi:hypothetical protein